MPSGAPCIYKSGPAWHERQGPQAQRYIREARPVYDHPIAGSWLKIGAEVDLGRPSRLRRRWGEDAIFPTPDMDRREARDSPLRGCSGCRRRHQGYPQSSGLPRD